MFEFIIHYRDGSEANYRFQTEQEMFEFLMDHNEKPHDLREDYCEFGRVVDWDNIGGGE